MRILFKIVKTFFMISTFSTALQLCESEAVAKIEKLRSFKNLDPNLITVSGFSSGGAMAMQFHIAFSKDIHGSAVFSGLPYGCAAHFNESECVTCVCYKAGTENLVNVVWNQANAELIDHPSNLASKKVYVFFGKNDSGLDPQLGPLISSVYQEFDADVLSEFEIEAEHGFPTDFYGPPCGEESLEFGYINNCNFHGAFNMLNYLYGGNLIKPNRQSKIQENLYLFDQRDFVNGNPIEISLDDYGFMYLPSGCLVEQKDCKLHLALHGCRQSRTALGDIFPRFTGYLEVAELNNIIVIFPNAAPNSNHGNPNGCWNWWNYLKDNNFLNKNGPQMQTLHRIVQRVLGLD